MQQLHFRSPLLALCAGRLALGLACAGHARQANGPARTRQWSMDSDSRLFVPDSTIQVASVF